MTGRTQKQIVPGGKFFIPQDTFRKKIKTIKAFVFDWDGVFNKGEKGEHVNGSFTESDAMGINLMRFGYYLTHRQHPAMAVISGMNNPPAEYFVRREHFNALYSNYKNKREPFIHFCNTYGVHPGEVAYFFDDVLDLPVAAECGLRITIAKQTPLFNHYLKQHKLCDYLTANSASTFALREACEMILQMSGMFNEVIRQRIRFDGAFTEYMEKRNRTEPEFFIHE